MFYLFRRASIGNPEPEYSRHYTIKFMILLRISIKNNRKNRKTFIPFFVTCSPLNLYKVIDLLMVQIMIMLIRQLIVLIINFSQLL
ncbi:MAG: hypothetical protein BGO42_14285 [Flavobacterium sp. 40-81]|nr:MAG: hypothetical protein BGO42_14285 [Flavobacterium sp. 40-81]